MTFQELRYLAALAKTHHFGRAASLCGVSQPNLSMAIRKLEQQLGYALFERLPRGVVPTAQGSLLLPQAEKIVAALGTIEDLAAAQKHPLNTLIHLGGSPCLGPYLFPKIISMLSISAKETQVEFHEHSEDQLISHLQSGLLDLVITSQPTASGDLLSLALFEEPYLAALPAAHALAAKQSISAADFQAQTFIQLVNGSNLASAHMTWLGETSIDHCVRASSLEMLRELLAMNLGVSFLPALSVTSLLNNQICTKPLEPTWTRKVYLVWRASYPRPQVVELLRQTIAQCQWPFVTQAEFSSTSGQLVDNQRW